MDLPSSFANQAIGVPGQARRRYGCSTGVPAVAWGVWGNRRFCRARPVRPRRSRIAARSCRPRDAKPSAGRRCYNRSRRAADCELDWRRTVSVVARPSRPWFFTSITGGGARRVGARRSQGCLPAGRRPHSQGGCVRARNCTSPLTWPVPPLAPLASWRSVSPRAPAPDFPCNPDSARPNLRAGEGCAFGRALARCRSPHSGHAHERR
jgi:hypothetical protein